MNSEVFALLDDASPEGAQAGRVRSRLYTGHAGTLRCDDIAAWPQLLADMQHLRAEEGKYFTGYVFPDDVNWPAEHTTYTAAAVILAVDALAGLSGGADIMRGTTLAADFAEIALECGCESAASSDRIARIS